MGVNWPWNPPMNFSLTSNNTNEHFERCKLYGPANSIRDQALMTTGYAILFFLSLAGNTLIIAVFYKRGNQLRTPVNYFIVNMAVSDLLVPISVVPRRIQQVYIGWYPWLVGGVVGEILCRICNFFNEVSTTVSSQSMVFIAAERFWAIVFPAKSPLISKRTSPRFICFTWLFSMTFFSYYFFVHKLVYKENNYICDYSLPQIFENPDDLWRADRISLLIVFVVIPFVLMAIFYTAIIVTLHRQEKAAVHLSLEVQQQRTKENRRVTVMLLTVVVVFFISWTPHYIYFFLQYYLSIVNCVSIKRIYFCSLYMNYIYTAINPLIYYTFNTTYRQGFHELLCCPWTCLRGRRQGTVESENNQGDVQCQNDNIREEIELQVVPQN